MTPPTAEPAIGPPVAAEEPFEHTEHGVVRPDPFHWMKRVGEPAFLDHLAAERRWYDLATGHLGPLIDELASEMASRVPSTEQSVSWYFRGSYYYTRVPAGREYRQLLRNGNLATPEIEQVLLDLNDFAATSQYVEQGVCLLSPDATVLAYSLDLTGDEVYELRFRDLGTGQDRPDVIARSYYSGAWSADGTSFFYTVHDAAYRPHQVWRHRLGDLVGDDVLVLEESDERYELTVRTTRSGDVVLITAGSRDTREVWAIDARVPTATPASVGGRRVGVEYEAEHVIDGADSYLLLVTNDGASEFRLARCPVPTADQDHTSWVGVRPGNDAERLYTADAFAGHVVLAYRCETERRLRLLDLQDLAGDGIVVRPSADCGTIELAENEEFHTDAVVVVEQALLDPRSWSSVSLATGNRTPLLRREAPGYDRSRYLAERTAVASPDGTEVPVTLLRRADVALDGSAPALLYGYGAYEAVFEPEWDPALPSLLDRGVVYAYAHVRGGGEGGRRWWLDGRLARKQHTFTDHIAVADGLTGLIDGDRIATRGLSAGGLLQGAVFSQRPDRWRAVVAEVPFVDVVSTMFDPAIPLTVGEWDEWGDPRRRDHFDSMLAYSPYDNVPEPGGRPDLLVTGALHDPRVMVFEPAKWVAALRRSDPGWSARCLFRVETGAGAHAGPAGRFAHLAYEAEVYAWILDKLAG